MPSGYVLTPQTTAATSEVIDLTREPFPKTIYAVGPFGANTIAVNVVTAVDANGDASAVLPLYDDTGTAVTITATSQPLMVESPVLLQFVKTESVGATIGVALVEKGQ